VCGANNVGSRKTSVDRAPRACGGPTRCGFNIEGATIFLLLCAVGLLAVCLWWLAQEIVHRWRVRRRERMTA
jgi:hypothetical protein